MQKELSRIWRDEGVTMILVSHDLEEAIFPADRVLVMSKDSLDAPSLIEIGPSRPRDRSTADFVALRPRLVAEFGLPRGRGGACRRSPDLLQRMNRIRSGTARCERPIPPLRAKSVNSQVRARHCSL
ncbi:hypothetical protein [Paragemmobacter aquarius]|uniref:hypothetical protein n=1 Tax=Paragemmobacter aquarius TaxID=2169400 RepID=UPI001C1FFF19|nr:hypothetical protein [Gemmobacter aquarius]